MTREGQVKKHNAGKYTKIAQIREVNKPSLPQRAFTKRVSRSVTTPENNSIHTYKISVQRNGTLIKRFRTVVSPNIFRNNVCKALTTRP